MRFLLSINYFVWLILSAIFFAAGEFVSKKFAIQPKWAYVLAILFLYSLGALAWLPAILSKNQLSITGALWSVFSLLTTVGIGVVIFGEKLNGFGIVGISAAFIAAFFLSMN